MIINSLLDTDLYKFTMMQGVLHQFPWAMVEYEFKCRTPEIDFSAITKEIQKEVKNLCKLRFTAEELNYLRNLRYLKSDFIEFLRLFQLNSDFVYFNKENDNLSIIIKGPWLHTILFEIPILAIISELYSLHKEPEPDYYIGIKKLDDKIKLIKDTNEKNLGFTFCDFGTRRRFSQTWQEKIIKKLKQELPINFIGTSNMDLARRYNLAPIGTMAHEWLMASQALGPRLIDSQKFALEHWIKEYRGDLGIALSDVVGFDAFLKDFDLYFAKLFDGCRHDSGEPLAWGEKLISHYKSLNIDPVTKIGVFSDNLTFPKAVELAGHFKSRIKTAFGIGTNLTNDMKNKAVQIVIKMTSCQGMSVAKISDSTGKQMCKDDSYLDYLTKVFQIK